MARIAITCDFRGRLKAVRDYLVPALVVFVGANIPPLACNLAAIGV
ncbi:MAG: hypothetical protein ABJN52_13730 [Litorimonas sp.]